MWGRLAHRWRQYRYRFVPWIALNLKDRSIRNVPKGSTDKVIPDSEVADQITRLFSKFIAQEKTIQNSQLNPDEKSDTILKLQKNQQSGDKDIAAHNFQQLRVSLGFTIKRSESKIFKGGRGVIVSDGHVPKGSVVGFYPGVIYNESEPVLLQSIRNPFIFRCIDRVLIDGNDKGISKYLYRSCAHRDRVGPYFICDTSWLTEHPSNPLAVGQYVNNHNKEFPANVAYQEFDFPPSFPFELRQFIPNLFYSSTNTDNIDCNERSIRTVVLISTQDISQGEELFSSYFTVVH